MILTNVMAQLATRLDTIADLNVFAYPPDSAASPPVAIVDWPVEIAYDSTFKRGRDRMTLTVLLLVSRVSDRSAMEELAAYCDGSGARSIKTVLEAGNGTYTAMNTVQVTRVDFEPVTWHGVPLSAAFFDVEISGSGT